MLNETLKLLECEIEDLREELVLTENDRDEWEVKARDLLKENKELKEELQHYRNTKAIQKANADSIIYWTYTISKI